MAVLITRSWSPGRTLSLPFRTRETVALLRPAARATSWILTFDRGVFLVTLCPGKEVEIDYLGFFDACSGKPYGLIAEAALKSMIDSENFQELFEVVSISFSNSLQIIRK